MKKLSVVLIVCMMLCAFVGCGGKKKDEQGADDKTVDIAVLGEKLLSELTFEDSLSLLDDAIALKYYGIDEALVKDCAIYVSTGATSEEIAVFEANSSEDAEKIYEACNTRRDVQEKAYADYKPSEVDRLKHYYMEKQGSYVVFCVNNDDGKIKEIVDREMK